MEGKVVIPKLDPLTESYIIKADATINAIQALMGVWKYEVYQLDIQKFVEFGTLDQVLLEVRFEQFEKMQKDGTDGDNGQNAHLVELEDGFVVDLKEMHYHNTNNMNMDKKQVKRFVAGTLKR